MMRLRWTLVAASLVMLSTAQATSWVKIPPHDPSKACATIETAVAQMTGAKPDFDLWPLYFSDDFGHVEFGERAAFIRSMTSAHDKPDNKPLRITMVWPVGKRKAKDAKALYVIGLQRDRWFPEREGSFDPMQIEPAGYQIDTSYWLVTFSGQNILEVREGRSYFDFVKYDRRLKGCADN